MYHSTSGKIRAHFGEQRKAQFSELFGWLRSVTYPAHVFERGGL
jgi:hypothetical protein